MLTEKQHEKKQRIGEARKGLMLKHLADKKAESQKSTFSVAIDKKIKEKTEEVCQQYDFSVSFLVNHLLKEFLNET